jgi:hypothetical protein
MTSLCEKIIVAKSKEAKTASYLAESSKEGYESKRAVFPMMIMIMLMNYRGIIKSKYLPINLRTMNSCKKSILNT